MSKKDVEAQVSETTVDKEAMVEATYNELVEGISDIIPEVEAAKEAPPVTAKKSEKAKKEAPLAVLKMKLKDLELSENWNRDKLLNVDKLSQSILAEGQLVPIIIRYREDGKAEIVDGRRRYAALKEAGINEALVSVTDCTDERTAYRRSTAANLARMDHTPLELCRTFAKLRDMGDKVKEISKAMGFSESQVSQFLKLEVLPEEAKKLLNAEKLDFTAARALCRLNYDDPRDVKYFDRLVGAIKEGKMTATTVEAAVEVYLEKRKNADKASGKKEDKKKGGRKSTSKKENYDYLDTDYLKSIKPIPSKKVGEYLNLLQEKKNNARNPKMRGYFEGEMAGAQKVLGLMDLD